MLAAIACLPWSVTACGPARSDARMVDAGASGTGGIAVDSGGASGAGGGGTGGGEGGTTGAAGQAGEGGAGTGGASGSGGSTDGGTGGGGASGGSGTGGGGGTGGIDVIGPPFTVKAGLFDQTKPDDLGLSVAAGTETITIFRPTDASDHYANGVVLTAFKGWLYAQWQSSATDEDSADTWTAYSRSQDGKTWSAPSAGNLPSGAAYFVSNPVLSKTRIPLAVTLSRDGRLFDKAFVLRKGGADLQAQRYAGSAKTLGYSYPKSVVTGGYLYVGYATNKEDVQLTRVPLTSLGY